MGLFERTERFFERLTAAVAVAGGLGLILATLVTCLSILLKLTRRSLDAMLGATLDPAAWSFVRPILGEEELVALGVGLALFAALPWAMFRRGHVRIDLFEAAFGPRLNRLLDLIGDATLAALAYLIMTRQWFLIFNPPRRAQAPMLDELLAGNLGVLGERLRANLESQILAIPLWPTYIVAEVCVALFFVVACFCVLRSLRALVAGGPA